MQQSYAKLSATLLNDAAAFFKTLANENEQVRAQMKENAATYERMAELIAKNPTGSVPGGNSYAQLTGKLLRDTATFYRKIAGQNPPLQEHLEQTATIYDQIADAVINNPLGLMD